MGIYFISHRDNLNNNACITPWSIIHFLSGIMLIILNILVFKINTFWKIFIIYNLLHLIYEIKDYCMTNYQGMRNYVKININESLAKWSITNSVVNCYCDQIIFCCGLLFGYYIFYIKKLTNLIYPTSIMLFIVWLYFINNKKLK